MSALADEIRQAVKQAITECGLSSGASDTRLRTVPDTAKYLALSIRTKEMMARGELPVVRRGSGRVMLDTRDLDAWIEAHKE